MDQRLNFVTLATADLDVTRRFYGSLGWASVVDVEGEIVMYQLAPGLVLGFFDAAKFNADLATGGDHSAVSGVTLAQNLGGRDEVHEFVAAWTSSGGSVVKPAQEGAFGGVFHALVADPLGVVWEIAHNPGWSVADDGTVTFG